MCIRDSYLTQERPGAKGEGKYFKNLNEAILAYENGVITLHSKIKVRVTKTMPNGEVKTGNVESTPVSYTHLASEKLERRTVL